MSANPSALLQLWDEFHPHEDQAVFAGIFAAKGGYHNTRYNHQHNINGGKSSDYSVQTAADLRGPADKGAAIDITFKDAQAGNYETIEKYSRRLSAAMQKKDSRLYYQGKMVVREFFGNTNGDNKVDGWSLYRGYALSSDPSHLWHIHISFFREFVENWEACKGVLAVLLGESLKPILTPSNVKILDFPGADWFKTQPNHPYVTALGKRLVAVGCGQYKDGPGPQWTDVDKASYAQWQVKCGYSGSDADGWPGKESWDKLKVPNPDFQLAPPAPKPDPAPTRKSDVAPKEPVMVGMPARLVKVEDNAAIYVIDSTGRAWHVPNAEALDQGRKAGYYQNEGKPYTITQEELDKIRVTS